MKKPIKPTAPAKPTEPSVQEERRFNDWFYELSYATLDKVIDYVQNPSLRLQKDEVFIPVSFSDVRFESDGDGGYQVVIPRVAVRNRTPEEMRSLKAKYAKKLAEYEVKKRKYDIAMAQYQKDLAEYEQALAKATEDKERKTLARLQAKYSLS